MKRKYDLNFTKAVASGNDFIIIDDINGEIKKKALDYSEMARALCPRRLSVGADGILILEGSDQADFKMRIINPDGSEVTMCGNGARCSALYARTKKWTDTDKMSFETGAGIIHSEVAGESVKINMGSPKDIKLDINLGVGKNIMNINFIDTGVPHVVHLVADLDNYPVKETGRLIREHTMFEPAGTNVNFVGEVTQGETPIRTYERGVEDETLACGTGTTASAIILGLLGMASPPVKILTKSGEVLTVYYKMTGRKITDVYLEGSAKIVYEGRV